MSYIETAPIKNSTIIFLYSEKNDIKLDPPYQRMGGVWTKEKKQLLIDSILNDYDIPKIYFHAFDRSKKAQTGITYAVIDGRQRLETIWDFIDGKFSLSSDFEYQREPTIKLANLGYSDIAKAHPRIKIKFDSFVLPVISVETDDEELIEDMFTRLNEAVPLNAAEKRNSISGDLVRAIRDIALHDFFVAKVLFNNRRYQHREVAARFLLIEDATIKHGKIIDTKKVYLDALAIQYANNHTAKVTEIESNVEFVLDKMCEVFLVNDELLRSQGNLAVYYLLFRSAATTNELEKITRRKLLDFFESLKTNRIAAAEDYENSSFELLEFDRLTQQGTNDASNIRERYRILAADLGLIEQSI